MAIIGGGPAGSFFALYLLHYAREKDVTPEITIYQERDFAALGPKGCKGCAGILSMGLFQNFRELGLTPPPMVVQSRIERYAVHSPYTTISIGNPEPAIHIHSIYRGGGPRISHYENPISFDGWLMGQVQERGEVEIRSESVTGIDLGSGARIEVAGETREYDLIVLASGVNAKPIPIRGLDYVRPPTRLMAQDELRLDKAELEARLGNTAHIFLIPHSELVFGTIVPKPPFVNVSLMNKGEQTLSVSDFLNYDLVRQVLPPNYERACGCRPRITVDRAQHYYGDRFVAIGDAALSRLYKDGIGSSLLGAREAARTAINHGVTRLDFARHYRPFCRSLRQDNQWGKLLFGVNNRAKNSRTFLLTQQRLIADEQNRPAGSRPYTKVVWGMFTGNYTYEHMVKMAFNPLALARLSGTFLVEGLRSLFRRKPVTYPRKLHVGDKKILILGSGFVGTYALRHLVRQLNRNESVETTIVSNENFFLFSPLLHEVAMGGVETRHIAYPIRRLQSRDRFNFIQAKVEKIDLFGRRVLTSRGELGFDYLVLGLGSRTDLSQLPAEEENVFMLKTLRDAMSIRNHIIAMFEQASMETDPDKQRQMLTFVVSGGGHTGIQLVAELRDLIFRSLLRFYKRINPAHIRIMLVEADSKVVGRLDHRLVNHIMGHLERNGIEVRLRSRVTDVKKDSVEINGEEVVPTHTLIWVAGVVAHPRIAEMDVDKDSIGRVLVNQFLEVPGFPGVYAAGDAAHFKDPATGESIPPRAHNAVRQAKIVAHNILADIRGREKKPYPYENTVEILSLGLSDAVMRYRGLRIYGFPARVMWLAGYSLLVLGMYNRWRILDDWIMTRLFGRDITLLRLKGR